MNIMLSEVMQKSYVKLLSYSCSNSTVAMSIVSARLRHDLAYRFMQMCRPGIVCVLIKYRSGVFMFMSCRPAVCTFIEYRPAVCMFLKCSSIVYMFI